LIDLQSKTARGERDSRFWEGRGKLFENKTKCQNKDTYVDEKTTKDTNKGVSPEQ
jgi:hypothetical protein